MRDLAAAAICLLAYPAPAVDDEQDTKAELMRLERAWLDAYDNNDAEAMDRIVADDFTICYGSATVLDKKQTIAKLDRAPRNPASKQYTRETKVRIYGDAAVLTGIYIGEWVVDGEKRVSRSRYTDTYIKIDGRWQVVASQLTNFPEE